MTRPMLLACIFACPAVSRASAENRPVPVLPGTGVIWKHLSSKNGDLPGPNGGLQQTSSVVFDADKDGINDFAVTERTVAPAVVLYLKQKDGWKKFFIEKEFLPIEAGSCAADIDGDGDPDLIAGGEVKSNEVWWWENPSPKFDAGKPWKRRVIKSGGATKHHDQIAGDFDGDGKEEILFWNQGAGSLMWATIPKKPRATEKPWDLASVFVYSRDNQPVPRNAGGEPKWKSTNEHEGLFKADIDGDGVTDLVAGGYWWKSVGSKKMQANPVDPTYTFTRAAAGQLIEGGRPEILLCAGDGLGPLMMYEWKKGTWTPRVLLDGVQDGHSLAIVDINKDGHQDIFAAEMRIGGRNPTSKMYFLLGDGKGGFLTTVSGTGFDNHETKVVDLDGDGTLDLLGKPYNFETPHIQIWLNMGFKK